MSEVLGNMNSVFPKWEQLRKVGPENNTRPPTDITGRKYIRARRTRGRRSPTAIVTLPSVITQFKVSPTALTNIAARRPLQGQACPLCVPDSKDTTMAANAQLYGIKNFLKPETMNNDHSLFCRCFPYLANMYHTFAGFTYPDVSAMVLARDRVQQAIEVAATQDLEDEGLPSSELVKIQQKHVKRAEMLLRDMKTKLCAWAARVVAWVLFHIMGYFLKGIYVHKGQLEAVRKASQTGHPVILLPMHRSHIDYIALTFIFYNASIKLPLVASGENMNFYFFGSALKGVGAYFIKRKLEPVKERKDLVYRALLHTYVEESLRAGHSMEIFIEGGRSRTGKSCHPKGGLLSIVVKSVIDNIVPEAYIVPVAVSYDKLVDKGLVEELVGKKKKPESFVGAIKGIWKALTRKGCSLRVDFAQPFSLREFVEKSQDLLQYSTTVNPDDPVQELQNPPPSPPGLHHRAESIGSLSGLDIVEDNLRTLIRRLGLHATYDSLNALSLMNTQIVAYLLLNKYRTGTCLNRLVQSFAEFREDLGSRFRDVGFSGENDAVVRHALELLGPDLVKVETMNMNELATDRKLALTSIKPVVEIPRVMELMFYSNTVLSVYALDSIVASALYTLVGQELEVYIGTGNTVRVKQSELLAKAVDLADMLQFEFILVSPCQTLDRALLETVERLQSTEILKKIPSEKKPGDEDEDWARRFSKHVAAENEETRGDNEIIEVSLTSEVVGHLRMLRNGLAPFIDSYWLVVRELSHIVGKEVDQQYFIKSTLMTATGRYHTGQIKAGESVNLESFRNALTLLETWKVIETYTMDNVQIINLTDEYDCEQKINDLISFFAEFRK